MLADSRLITLSGELENLVGDSTCMRYPDRLDFPKIPNDVYKERDARQAEKVAREILENVRSRVFWGTLLIAWKKDLTNIVGAFDSEKINDVDTRLIHNVSVKYNVINMN